MTCPNRDGKIDTRGCIFCSAGGSGEFAAPPFQNCKEQIAYGLSLMQGKKTGSGYIAYFQSYTNTYAPVSKLRSLYQEALEDELIAGISIATRPDCLPDEVLSLLAELKSSYPDKFIWIELGLQTIHEETAGLINRCYPLSVFDEAMEGLRSRGIRTVVHLILGLPGETRDMMLQSVRYVANQPDLFGMKLHLLNVVKGSAMEKDYADYQPFSSIEEYVNLVVDCLEIIPPSVTIHRLTGDAPRSILISPPWSFNKRTILNGINDQLHLRDTWQGKKAGL